MVNDLPAMKSLRLMVVLRNLPFFTINRVSKLNLTCPEKMYQVKKTILRYKDILFLDFSLLG